jgi:phage shock protein C
MVDAIKTYFERKAFGVCEWWGKKLGISAQRIRVFFIYLSFITIGSPLVIYLIMAFILEHKEVFKSFRSRKTIWDI